MGFIQQRSGPGKVPRPPSDEEILRMLHASEQAEEAVDMAVRDAELAAQHDAHEACPFCGEPAEHLGSCVVCHEDGCLPPDLWSPGQQDPCLTLCVRCAREIHWACAIEDEAGNPRCATCRY